MESYDWTKSEQAVRFSSVFILSQGDAFLWRF